MPDIQRRRRFLIRASLLTLLGSAGVAAFVFLFNHPPTDASFYPKCTLHSATGLHCPGCGLTRSLYSTLHGDFRQAVAWNVLAPLLLPLYCWGILNSLRSMIFPQPGTPQRDWQPTSRWRSFWIPVAMVIALAIFGILRNLPGEPFVWLAPHEIRR